MDEFLDYRLPEHRLKGFDLYYETFCKTKDSEPDVEVLKYLAKLQNADFEFRCSKAFMYGFWYSGPTAEVLSRLFPVINKQSLIDYVDYLSNNKIVFSADARYRYILRTKICQSIIDSLDGLTLGQFIQKHCTSDHGRRNFNALLNANAPWYHWKMGANWIFTESLHSLIPEIPIDASIMAFGNNSKSNTKGWCFVMNKDNWYEQENWKADQLIYLHDTAGEYLEDFKKRFPKLKNADFFTLETACCNYKRAFKGTRYAICYIDAQYDECKKLLKKGPHYKKAIEDIMEARQACFHNSVLYENHETQSDHAYVKAFSSAYKDYGTMPRVASFLNGKPQIWNENYLENSLNQFFN